MRGRIIIDIFDLTRKKEKHGMENGKWEKALMVVGSYPVPPLNFPATPSV